MNYSFKPLTDDELENVLAEDGIYDFVVIKETHKISEAGNSMAELQMNFTDKFGEIHSIFDFLVFSDVKLNIKKVSHFSKTTGKYEEYKKGFLSGLLGLRGKFHIGTQKEKEYKGKIYPKKNIVIDYVVPVSNYENITKEFSSDSTFDKKEDLNDDIPF